MTPQERTRLLTLRAKVNRNPELTREEEIEYEALVLERKREKLRMCPSPQCCEAIRIYPAVAFTVDYDRDGDSHKATGRWYVKPVELIPEVADWRLLDPDLRPVPQFCPYCGTPLPKMRRKDPVPKTVCRVTDGGYYCDTCRERLDYCLCDPLSSAFEPEP